MSEAKAPRKPRPSEIAAKKAKAATAKKKTKPAPKAKKAAKPAAVVVRSQRLDMRLSKAEKAKVFAKAKTKRRTVTSLVLEAIEAM